MNSFAMTKMFRIEAREIASLSADGDSVQAFKDLKRRLRSRICIDFRWNATCTFPKSVAFDLFFGFSDKCFLFDDYYQLQFLLDVYY